MSKPLKEIRLPEEEHYLIAALRAVLADRERELLELKGPCSNEDCTLHYAHAGPCNKP